MRLWSATSFPVRESSQARRKRTVGSGCGNRWRNRYGRPGPPFGAQRHGQDGRMLDLTPADPQLHHIDRAFDGGLLDPDEGPLRSPVMSGNVPLIAAHQDEQRGRFGSGQGEIAARRRGILPSRSRRPSCRPPGTLPSASVSTGAPPVRALQRPCPPRTSLPPGAPGSSLA